MSTYHTIARAARQWHVSHAFEHGAEGEYFSLADAFAAGRLWEDTARAIPASVDGPVGSLGLGLQRYYAEQATSGAKPILRTDGTRHWVEGDGSKWLGATMDTVPGSCALIAAMRATVSISGGNNFSTVMANGLSTSGDIPGGQGLAADGLSPNLQFRSLVRVSGANNAVASVQNALHAQDVVVAAIYDADAGTNQLYVQGQLVASASGVSKLSTSTSFTLMAREGGSVPFIGRLYAGALVAGGITAVQRRLLERWAASHGAVVLP